MYAFGQSIQVGQVGKKPLLTVLLSYFLLFFHAELSLFRKKKLISF